MNQNNLIISIDGGGSKTDFLIADIKKKLKYEYSTSGSNPNFHGSDGLKNLFDELKKIQELNNINVNDIKSIVLGLAGISNKKYKNDLNCFFKNFYRNSKIILTSDAELAHKTIWGNNIGTTLLVGTGSIGISNSNKNKKLIISGGLGFENNDVGSGYWIAKTLILFLISNKNIFKNNFCNELIDLVKEHYNKKNFDDVLDYALGHEGKFVLANLSPKIIKLAKMGNEIAYKICDDGCEGLKEILTDLKSKNNFFDTIGIHGSIILKNEFYRKLFFSKLVNINWIKSEYKSVFGGLTVLENINPNQYKKFTNYG